MGNTDGILAWVWGAAEAEGAGAVEGSLWAMRAIVGAVLFLRKERGVAAAMVFYNIV